MICLNGSEESIVLNVEDTRRYQNIGSRFSSQIFYEPRSVYKDAFVAMSSCRRELILVLL